MKCSSFPQTESARKPTVHAGTRLPWRQNSSLETEWACPEPHLPVKHVKGGTVGGSSALNTPLSLTLMTRSSSAVYFVLMLKPGGGVNLRSVSPPCKFTSSNTSWLSCCGFHTCGIENDGIQRGVAQFLRPFLHRYRLSNDWYKHI